MGWTLSRTSTRNSDIETLLTGFFTDVMVQHYNPGQRMQTDFSGGKLYWSWNPENNGLLYLLL
ncbi:MAG: hypothetical protein ABIS36_03465 [Chryseolinea sp.]